MRSRGRLARDHVRQLPDVSPGDARPVPRAIALGAIQEGHERGSEAVSSSTRRPPSASGQCGADAGTRPARMGAGGYRGTVARARPPVSGSDGGAIGDAADRHGVRSRDRRLTDRRGHGRDQEFCHLRLRHNLEGPETVITPRLSDELCPVGAPALGQDQRGQAVLGRPCPRACLSSQFGPRPCAPNHSDPAPATVPGPDHCPSRWHPVPLARRMDSSSTVGANTQAGMSFGGGMPHAGGMMMRQDTTVASTPAAHSPLIRGRRQGRSRPVTRRLPFPGPIA